MQQFIVEANLRAERGKNAARRIRRTGLVPATLYGGKGGPVAVNVNAKQVVSILKSESGHNTIFTLKLVGGGEDKVIVKDWQADPVRGDLLHVDLLRIAMDVRMRVKVPVHTFGEPQGVKVQGGIFEMVTREVEIECLPTDIPEEFRFDVTPLMIGKQLRAGDLPLDPVKLKLLTDPQRVLAHVVALRIEEEKSAEVAAAEVAAPAEPEVIKKGKKEVVEGEEGEAEPEKSEKKK
ncbi:MAG: 50S ribosomal protein L25 [Acidobacteria bacterium]|nr:50S ribosomal protein L25 [Acidobacteriota bacterium]MBI3663085.1 50S ribosomal protein L25 [Acidobacteriota bacterium]